MRGGKFYVFGGQQDVPAGAPDEAAFLNDLWCFDLQNRKWTPCDCCFSSHAGTDTDTGAHSYSVKAGNPHWTQIEYDQSAPTPPKRTGHTIVTYADCLYL